MRNLFLLILAMAVIAAPAIGQELIYDLSLEFTQPSDVAVIDEWEAQYARGTATEADQPYQELIFIPKPDNIVDGAVINSEEFMIDLRNETPGSTIHLWFRVRAINHEALPTTSDWAGPVLWSVTLPEDGPDSPVDVKVNGQLRVR